MPHVIRMPQPAGCKDSFLCPIAQASPYFFGKAFPEVKFLSPRFDFTKGYAASTALIDMAERELLVPRDRAEFAWAAAVRAQTKTEDALRELGRRARTSFEHAPGRHFG